MPRIAGVDKSGHVVGQITPIGQDTQIPPGSLLCNGTAVSRTVYALLFAKLGIVHGQGDGSTTFNLPDYRGRFLRGRDAGQGRDPDAGSRTAANTGGAAGDAVGSVQVTAVTTHAHSDNIVYSDTGHTHNVQGFQGGGTTPTRLLGDTNSGVNQVNAPTGNGTANLSRVGGVLTSITSATSSSESRPVNANVAYVIAYV